MSDPLSLLREHSINKRPISHDATHITIGDLKFPRNTLTAYKQDRGRGDPYPLEALYYLLQKPHLAGAAKTRQYAEDCKSNNFQRVLLADQKDVLAYLQGKQETSQYLVSVEELTSLAAPTSEPSAVTAKTAEKEKAEKRKREEPVLDMTNEDIVAAKKELATKIDGIVSTVPSGPEQKKQARFPVEWGNKEDSIEVTKSAYILADAAVTRALVEKERTHVNRTTCLHANKDLRQLHDILRSAIAPKAKAAKAAAAQASRPAAAQPSAGQRRDRYNVSGVEAFKAAGMDAELLRAEQQGSSLLAGPGTGNPSKKDGKGDEPKIRKAPLNLEPIIIVPQAPSAVITKWNIKELLENGVYRTREEQKKAGYRPEDRVSVIHREESHNGLHSYHYKVVDSAEAMKKDDWQRVVAVFVQGPEWQFKGWDLSSFGGKMVNMFQRVSAFHVVFDKEQPHDNVRKMTVHLLSMSRASRNLDNQVRQNFWDHLKAQHRLASQIRAKANGK